MPKKQASSKETSGTFNLSTASENTYAGQDAQEAAGARRVLSMIPKISGEMVRELGQAKYLPTQLPTKIGALMDYPYNDSNGVRQSVRFAVATSDNIVFALYKEVAGAWVVQTLPLNNGLTSNAPFNDFPQFVVLNNLLHITDGTTSWIYDGPNAQFVIEGFIIPPVPPNIENTGFAGTFSCSVGRFYWITYADHTVGRVHESSSSPISTSPVNSQGSTGPVANKSIQVQACRTLVTTTIGLTAITTGAGGFFPQFVGMNLYIGAVNYGRIATFTDSAHMILDTPAPASNAGVNCIIAPPRATHIHFYCSETDGSRLGKFLTSISVLDPNDFIMDQVPFITDPTSTISTVDRPIRNDPPAPSKIAEVHKYRIFRRREAKPNFFHFSGNEEISAGNGNGSPQESYPGAAGTVTMSDIVDEQSYPQSANRLRGLKSHADALWLGTEKGIVPLYGNSIDDFGLMQVVTITGGVISRWGMETTPHGLTIFGYDRLLKLYPPISPIYSILPQDLNVTDQLLEIGRPMRKKFLTIKNVDQDNVRTLHYQYNERDWLVVCYQDNTSTYHTYIYDFAIKGWFESQRGFASVAVFEPIAGNVILVGGGTDGFVYVIDDLSGTFSNATCPAAIFRPALINFGRPDIMHQLYSLEYELTNDALSADVTVNFYLDPQDADNPGAPFGPLNFAKVPNSAARYRAYFAATDGVVGTLCKRALIEFQIASSTNTGGFRGIMLKAWPVDAEVNQAG